MSEEYRPGCTGKRAYESRGAARDVAKDVRATTGRRSRSYECDHCGKWHLTSSSKPREALRSRNAPARSA